MTKFRHLLALGGSSIRHKFLVALGLVLGSSAALVAATLTASISTTFLVNYRGANDLGAPVFSLAQQNPIVFASGTGSDQANLLFADTRALGASGTENLDVAGVLVDPFGTALTFTQIKAIKICASPQNINNVVVGNAATNTLLGIFSAATGAVNVKPGGCFVWIAPQQGAPVTPNTGDILLITNSGAGTSVTYDVVIIGS